MRKIKKAGLLLAGALGAVSGVTSAIAPPPVSVQAQTSDIVQVYDRNGTPEDMNKYKIKYFVDNSQSDEYTLLIQKLDPSEWPGYRFTVLRNGEKLASCLTDYDVPDGTMRNFTKDNSNVGDIRITPVKSNGMISAFNVSITINDKPGYGAVYGTYNNIGLGQETKVGERKNTAIREISEEEAKQQDGVYVFIADVPETANSSNLYNLVNYQVKQINRGEKWEIDLSKVNSDYLLEKDESYADHQETVYNALEKLGINDIANTVDALSPVVGAIYEQSGSIHLNKWSPPSDYRYNYSNEVSFTDLGFVKTVDGYTATQDFEFLIEAPAMSGDLKTRFNLAVPNDLDTQYRPRSDAYTLLDIDKPATYKYITENLKYYLQLTVPNHMGEHKEDKMFESVASQIEKSNIAETVFPWYPDDKDGKYYALEDGQMTFDELINRIKTNSGGVLNKDADHLKSVLEKVNWSDFFSKIHDAFNYDGELPQELIDSQSYEYLFKPLFDAGLTQNDMKLLHLAGGGGLALTKETLEDCNVRGFYETLVGELGIANHVTYTEGGFAVFKVKEGETIKFNDLSEYYKNNLIMFIEKSYDDTESVRNRSYVLGLHDGTTNIYAGGDDSNEPREDDEKHVEEKSENSEEKTDNTENKSEDVVEAEDNSDKKSDEKMHVTQEVKSGNIVTKNEAVQKGSTPETGDTNMMPLFVGIAGAAGAVGITSAVLWRRKKNN